MKNPLLLLLVIPALAACTSGEKTMLFECNDQNVGEACNKLGKARTGEEALAFFRKGCQLENTNSCVNLAENTRDEGEAERSLKLACDKGNTTGCTKLAERLAKKAVK